MRPVASVNAIELHLCLNATKENEDVMDVMDRTSLTRGQYLEIMPDNLLCGQDSKTLL